MLAWNQVALENTHSFGKSIIVFRRLLAWTSLLAALPCIGAGTLFLLHLLDGSRGWLGWSGGVSGLVLIALGLPFLFPAVKPRKRRRRSPPARQDREDPVDLEFLVRWHENHISPPSGEPASLDQELRPAARENSRQFGPRVAKKAG